MVRIIISILILGLLLSCTEEVIKIKETVRVDTVQIFTLVPQIADTVTVTTVQTDTVFQDSIVYVIRDSIITVQDTIWQIKTDTVYITQYSIYLYYQDYVDRFYEEAKRYGWGDLPKNNLILTQWAIADIQANGYPDWYEGDGVSIAYRDGPQWHAKVNEILRSEKQFIPICRELGHVLLGKPYAALDADEVMNPKFQGYFTDRDYDEPIARPYLDKLFEH